MLAIIEDAGRSIVATFKGAVHFGGRSRIVDLIYFYIAWMPLKGVMIIATDTLSWDDKWWAGAAIDIVVALPMFALFGRRLHDQGLSAAWALILLPLISLDLYRSYRVTFTVVYPEWLGRADNLSGFSPIAFAAVAMMLILSLRPGTQGPNRYGADPRQRDTAA